MVYKVIFLGPFNDDIAGILNYLVNEAGNPRYASSLMDKIELIIDRLADNPEMYMVYAGTKYRRIVVDKYVIFYTIDGVNVVLARMFSSRQNYGDLLG